MEEENRGIAALLLLMVFLGGFCSVSAASPASEYPFLALFLFPFLASFLASSFVPYLCLLLM